MVSRPLLMGWCFWLLISWAVNLALDTPPSLVTDDAEALVPAVRGMVQSMMLGIGLIWPAWRLSWPGPASAGLQTATDLGLLLLVTQIVFWPMRLLVEWPIVQTLLLDVTLAAWSLPVAVCVWLGRRGAAGGARAGAMAGCVALLVGGPLLAALAGWPALAVWSPLRALWVLADAQAAAVNTAQVIWRLVVVAGVTAAAWAVALGAGRATPNHHGYNSPRSGHTA